MAVTAAPNDNYELREMVSVATAYLDQGMVDDADELLREALDSGYDRPDAFALRERLRSARAGVAQEAAPALPLAQPPGIAHFTTSLPGVERQTPETQRAIRISDDDLAFGRLHSAFDETLHAIALAPGYFPMYVRLAEIRFALGGEDDAAQLVALIADCVAQCGSDDDWMLLPLHLSLHPDDTDSLVRYATFLLEQADAPALEPHVPAAIEYAIDQLPDVAMQLASRYLQARPGTTGALRLYVRAALAQGDVAAARTALLQWVDASSPADLAYLRAILAAGVDRETWLAWMERVCARLAAEPGSWEPMPAALALAERLTTARWALLSAAMTQNAARRYGSAIELLDRWQLIGPNGRIDHVESFLAAATRALALRDSRQPRQLDALVRAAAEGVIIDMRAFADSTTVFGTSVAPAVLLEELVATAKELAAPAYATGLLRQLRDRFPENLEIRAALADLEIASGSLADGIRELRHVAERHEQNGDLAGMVSAMRHISAAMPTNAEAKAKLIDGYLQRGVLDEAIRELGLLGELHVKRGKRLEAVAAFTRAADIAGTSGNLQLATAMFDRAADVDPDNVAVRHAAVAFFLQSGAVDRAAAHLWEVVRIGGAADDPDEAVAALHQIIALTPADPDAYHKLGEVLASMGEYTQAERVYRRLAQLTPDDPVLAAKQSALGVLSSRG